MPLLSLCMIVRDEQDMLGACLASVRGAVDDVVVVDTGSRDDTRRIAAERGARVFDFAWRDDFAAARNESLRHARGRWVLVLDADERLAPGAAPTLRRVVRHAAFDLGLLRLHDAARSDATPADVLSGVERVSEVQLVPRLIRRTDGLAFVDRIHENVAPWLRRRGNKIAGVDADIVHYGATPEIVAARGKNERNLRMLRERVELDGADVCAAGYLAHELMRAGHLREAFEVTERAWSRVAEAVSDASPSIHRLATARAHLLILRGDPQAAHATVLSARALEGDNPDLRYFEGFALELLALAATAESRAELLEQARQAYEMCAAFRGRVFAQSFVVGATSWASRARLGVIAMLRGRSGDALLAFEEVLSVRPGDMCARLGRAEALLDLGQPAQALRLLEQLLHEGAADAWVLAAASAQKLGRVTDARLLARRALDGHAQRPVAPHLRGRLRDLAESLSHPAPLSDQMTPLI